MSVYQTQTNDMLLVNTNLPNKEVSYNSTTDFNKAIKRNFNTAPLLSINSQYKRRRIIKYRPNPFGYYPYAVYNVCRSKPLPYKLLKKNLFEDNGTQLTRKKYKETTNTYYNNYNPNFAITYNLSEPVIAPKSNASLYKDMFYLPSNSSKVDPQLKTNMQMQFLNRSLVTADPSQIDYYKSARDSAMSNAYQQYLTKNSKIIAKKILQNKQLNSWHAKTIKQWIQNYKQYHYQYILNPLLNCTSNTNLQANNLGNNSNLTVEVVNGHPVLKIKNTNLYVTNAGYQLLANLPTNQLYLNRESCQRIKGQLYFTNQFGKLIPSSNVPSMYFDKSDDGTTPNSFKFDYKTKYNKWASVTLKLDSKIFSNKNQVHYDTLMMYDYDSSIFEYITPSWSKYETVIKHCTKKQQQVNDYRADNGLSDNEMAGNLPGEVPRGIDIPCVLNRKQRQYLLKHPFHAVKNGQKYYIEPVVHQGKYCLPFGETDYLPMFDNSVAINSKQSIFRSQSTINLSKWRKHIWVPIDSVQTISGMQVKQK